MVTSKVMVPTGKTSVPLNSTKGVSEGMGCSLLTIIYWNAR